MRWGLAVGMTALAACGGAGEGPVGVAVEAAGAKPVIDYPIDFAPRERVPPVLGWARLAPHGDGYLAAWIESDPLGPQRIEASFLGADGAPLQSSSFSLGSGPSVLDAACAPAGDCVVLWNAGLTVGLELTHLTAAGASKPIRMQKGPSDPGSSIQLDGRVAYDPAATAFVVVWSDEGADGVLARHFQDGALVEAKPLPIAPAGAAVEALACSAADGCLVAYWSELPPSGLQGAIVTATTITPPVPLAVPSSNVSLTWGGGVYLAVGRGVDSFAFSRLGVDGAAIDPAPEPPTFPEPASYIAGTGFDGEAFTLLAFDRQAGNIVSSAARVLPDGTPATPAGFELDGLGLPFALACSDKGCAAAVDFDPDHETGLSAVPITDGAPGAPRAISRELGGQGLEATFSFGDKAFAVWNENSVVRTRWFANDATAASPVVDIDTATTVEAGTFDRDAGLLVAFHDDGPRSARVVSSAGVGAEHRFEPPATTLRSHARFAWLDDAPFNGKLSLRRFDAEGRLLDADPIPIVGPHPDDIAFGEVARSGDLFVVVTSDNPRQIEVTRVRDTGEIIDQVTLPHAFFQALACSPTECLIADEKTFDPKTKKPFEVRLVRFASHADTLAFDVSTLDTGSPDQVAWDGARFLVTYLRDAELRLARLDDDGPVIGARLAEGSSPRFLAPLADDRALLFGQAIRGNAGRPAELADVSLILVDGFPAGPPPAPPGASDGVVASGGACALVSTAATSSTRDAATVGVLLLAAAALRLRGRRRIERRPGG